MCTDLSKTDEDHVAHLRSEPLVIESYAYHQAISDLWAYYYWARRCPLSSFL